MCPPALAQRGWIPAWPLAQTPHSAPCLEGKAGNQPRSQSQRLEWLCHLRGTKAFSALGQYCHSPAVPPASGAWGRLLRAAFQLHYGAPLLPSLKLRLFFHFLLPLKPPPGHCGGGVKASQGSCGEEAGPLRGQRAGEAAAWHPHMLSVPPQEPHCILNGFLSMFWDGSHKSGARNQGWWGLSPLHLCGAAPESVPALYRAGFPKVDVSQGCPRLVGAPGSAALPRGARGAASGRRSIGTTAEQTRQHRRLQQHHGGNK